MRICLLMLLGVQRENPHGRALFLRSTDLRQWEARDDDAGGAFDAFGCHVGVPTWCA